MSQQAKQTWTTMTAMRTWVLALSIFCVADAAFGKDIATKVAEFDERSPAGAMDFSPDGTQLAVDSWGNGGTDIWNVKKKRIVGHIDEGGTGGGGTQFIRYSPDGRLLAICHGTGGKTKYPVDIYDSMTWKAIHSMGYSCDAISFTPDGNELVVLSSAVPGFGLINASVPGNNITFYSTSTGQPSRAIRTYPLMSQDTRVRLERGCRGSLVNTPEMILDDRGNNSIAFETFPFAGVHAISKDGQYLALTGGTDVVCGENPPGMRAATEIIDILNHKVLRVIPAGASALDWNPDGVHVAAGMMDPEYKFKVFDIRSGETVASQEGKLQKTLVKYTPDGKYLIEADEKTVEIWDGHHEKLLQTIHAAPMCLTVSADSHYFAIGGEDNNILDAVPLVSLFVHPNGGAGKVIVYQLK